MRWLKTALAGAIVGTFTITVYLVAARLVMAHVAPLRGLMQLLQWDASNALGSAAFAGGWGAAGLGLLMDLVVAFCWAGVFLAAFRYIPSLRTAPLVAGFILGLIVMCVMFYAVVPLGHAQPIRMSVSGLVSAALAHSLFFGVPLAALVMSAERKLC